MSSIIKIQLGDGKVNNDGIISCTEEMNLFIKVD